MKTNKDYQVRFMNYGQVIVPAGTKVKHDTALGIDVHYNFVDEPEKVTDLNGNPLPKILVDDISIRGINVPSDYIDYNWEYHKEESGVKKIGNLYRLYPINSNKWRVQNFDVNTLKWKEVREHTLIYLYIMNGKSVKISEFQAKIIRDFFTDYSRSLKVVDAIKNYLSDEYSDEQVQEKIDTMEYEFLDSYNTFLMGQNKNVVRVIYINGHTEYLTWGVDFKLRSIN